MSFHALPDNSMLRLEHRRFPRSPCRPHRLDPGFWPDKVIDQARLLSNNNGFSEASQFLKKFYEHNPRPILDWNHYSGIMKDFYAKWRSFLDS